MEPVLADQVGVVEQIVEHPEGGDRAQLARLDQLLRPAQGRHVDVVVSRHAGASGALGGAHQAADVGRAMRDRLLDQHVLAGAQRGQRRGDVPLRRGQDVHGVHVGVADQLLQGAVVASAVPGGQRRGLARLGVVGADEPRALAGGYGASVQLRDQTRPHERDADAVVRSGGFCHAYLPAPNRRAGTRTGLPHPRGSGATPSARAARAGRPCPSSAPPYGRRRPARSGSRPGRSRR